jgi:hypothetical protein
MKKLNSKKIKKQLVDLINKSIIEEIIYEPRYADGCDFKKDLIGSTITIRTKIK